jgi:hypothetical protein
MTSGKASPARSPHHHPNAVDVKSRNRIMAGHIGVARRHKGQSG